MENQKFKTKSELIQDIGLSRSTFYRLAKKKNIQTDAELLSPQVQNEIRVALGFTPLPGFESDVTQIGTDWHTLTQRDNGGR